MKGLKNHWLKLTFSTVPQQYNPIVDKLEMYFLISGEFNMGFTKCLLMAQYTVIWTSGLHWITTYKYELYADQSKQTGPSDQSEQSRVAHEKEGFRETES